MIDVYAGWFSANEGKTFETKGTAVVMSTGSFSVGVEKKNISIPTYMDVTKSTSLKGLTHDSESGWTKCRVPVQGDIGWDGPRNKEVVFDCKPLTYFK